MPKFAGRAAIKGIARKTVDVALPGVDGLFRLREMSGAERDEFEIAIFRDEQVKIDGKTERQRVMQQRYLRARLVALCLMDETGEQRAYKDNEITACAEEFGSANLIALFEAAQKLNGLDGQAQEAAAKNSAAAPATAASTSD